MRLWDPGTGKHLRTFQSEPDARYARGGAWQFAEQGLREGHDLLAPRGVDLVDRGEQAEGGGALRAGGRGECPESVNVLRQAAAAVAEARGEEGAPASRG